MSSENTSIQTDSLSNPSSDEGSTGIQPSADKWEHFVHEVDHFKQRYSWDCGVACVMMLLTQQQREYFLDNFQEICADEGFNQSTWTVDLCYLLKRFGIKHKMYSTTLGVNEEYKKYSYYDNIFEMDRARVERRFNEAGSRGVHVAKGELSPGDVRRHLRVRGPIIALVDAGYLACDICKKNKIRSELKRRFGGSYCGHYVLVVGVSGSRVLYRDPAQAQHICAAAHHKMHAARTAPGTDQDLILIYNNYRRKSRSKSRESLGASIKTKTSSSQTLRRRRSKSKQFLWNSCVVQ